jgi:hypothetical protein
LETAKRTNEERRSEAANMSFLGAVGPYRTKEYIAKLDENTREGLGVTYRPINKIISYQDK